MENGYTADAMTEWYTGTVVEEATKTYKDMWGWSSETSNHRSQVFDDDEKEDIVAGKGGDDDSGAYLRAVDLLFLGIPMLVISFQLV
jgi:hypothetical protein